MELATLAFPIVQIFKHKKAARETQAILAEFDSKKLNSEPSSNGSMATRSTSLKRGKMFSMESLDECLVTNCDGLQVYASCMELNGYVFSDFRIPLSNLIRGPETYLGSICSQDVQGSLYTLQLNDADSETKI